MNRLLCLAATPLVLLVAAYNSRADTIRVAPGDQLQGAVDRLQAGDTLLLSPGVYRQPILIRAAGVPERPIRIEGDGAALFTGLAELQLDWQPCGDGLFSAKVDRPVRQLFVDGELMMPARWPDMDFSQRWDNRRWPAADEGALYGKMVDADLAACGKDFTGCMAILNIGSWQTFRRTVTQHAVGQGEFTYPTDPKSRLNGKRHPLGMDRYCIYGRAALDAPGEWFYDEESSTLLLYPPDDRPLEQRKVESKRLDEAIVVEDSQYVVLSGIQLVGATLRLENSDHCTIDGIDVRFGSTIVNPFGPNPSLPAKTTRAFSARKWFGESSVDALTQITGNDNVIRNLTVRYSEGPALTVGGERNLIENCLFQDNDWHGLDYGFGIDLLAAAPVTVRYVTLDHCGGSEGLRLSNHGRSLVEFCHLHHCGLRQSDGGIIQAATAGVAGTEIRYNWIHDHNAFHWGGNGIRGDDGTRGLLIHHNVVWNCSEKGIVTKGDQNRVYHNTCFDNPKIDILLPRNRLPGKVKELTEQNVRSQAFNNIGHVTGSWSWEKSKLPPYGSTGNNLDQGKEALEAPAQFDFRLRADSAAVDAGRQIPGFPVPFRGDAPDVGAFEWGDEAWTAGYDATRSK